MIDDLERRQKQLDALLSPFGIETGEDQRMLLLRHLELVMRKNQVLNLTRIVDVDDALVRHVVDSLLFLPSVRSFDGARAGSQRCVDIGSGAGYPGIPLAIVHPCEMLLVDSVQKKAAALGEFVEELGLGTSVACSSMRAEELASARREQFDVMTARAVADLGVLVEYASPLLAQGGVLVAGKARIDDVELARGEKTAAIAGMCRVSRETYELPKGQGHREILVFQKTGKSKVRLPRRVGLAKSKPLAGS
jgi:16S rRNA (guanine527-N7)-methyltransferase